MNIEQDGQLHKLVRKINRTTHPLNGRGTHVKFLTGEQLLEPEQPVLPGTSARTISLLNRQQQAGHVQFQQGTARNKISSNSINTFAGREPLYTRRDLHQSLQLANSKLQFNQSEFATHQIGVCSSSFTSTIGY
ncbi:unnamed protein product [Caenorhabditis brenneri]